MATLMISPLFVEKYMLFNIFRFVHIKPFAPTLIEGFKTPPPQPFSQLKTLFDPHMILLPLVINNEHSKR